MRPERALEVLEAITAHIGEVEARIAKLTAERDNARDAQESMAIALAESVRENRRLNDRLERIWNAFHVTTI